MPRRRPTRALVAALTAAALLAGCGPSDTSKVRHTLAAFQRATAAKDYRTLCGKVLAKALVDRLSSVGVECVGVFRRGLGGFTSLRLRGRRLRPCGDVALAEVRTSAAGQRPSDDTIRLVRQGDDWRVSTLSGPQPPGPHGG